MLEQYKKALSPQSILEIVPEKILQGLMKGFFFGHRAGMVLIFDEGKDDQGRLKLRRLEPVSQGEMEWRDRFENFNRFCAIFRQSERRDELCEQCDEDRARLVFDQAVTGVKYKCHMGLWDMTIPIKVNGAVRGVVYGGQLIDDSQKSLELIQLRVSQKAPDIADELGLAMTEAKRPEADISKFEQSLKTFAEGLQLTVEAFHRSIQNEAEREALLEISQDIGRSHADDASGWVQSAIRLMAELEDLAKAPLALLVRRGSRYEFIAGSPLFGQREGTLPVSLFITFPTESQVTVSPADPLFREISQKVFPGQERLTVIRSDSTISSSDTASILLIVGKALQDRLGQFFVGCVRVLAYPAGVALMFRKQEKQQTEFISAITFTGHHLKTPLQAALFAVQEAMMLTDVGDLHTPLTLAEKQITSGLADALGLQNSLQILKHERIDVIPMVMSVCERFQPIARKRNNTIRVMETVKPPCIVSSVPLHLRVAFSNLIDNAIKYSFEEKAVDLRFSLVNVSRLSTGRLRSHLRIGIENYGVGFDPHAKSKLFDAGFRVDDPRNPYQRLGEGIGLWQAKEYIEAAGGSLDIQSLLIPPRSPTSGGISRVAVVVHLPLVNG